jgi:hypothetical protein
VFFSVLNYCNASTPGHRSQGSRSLGQSKNEVGGSPERSWHSTRDYSLALQSRMGTILKYTAIDVDIIDIDIIVVL